MYALTEFGLRQMIEVNSALRVMGTDAGSMEEVADRIVHYLYDSLTLEDSSEHACALVRFFVSHPYCGLEPELREYADAVLGKKHAPPALPDTRCFTLLATRGMLPQWNSRKDSRGHKTFPYTGRECLDEIPMARQQFIQFGFDPDTVSRADSDVILDLSRTTFNVFYVPTALGSPYVPFQQDFVIPYSIESAISWGGVLPSANFYIVVLFTKVPVSREVAEVFKPLALGVRLALLPFDGNRVFSNLSPTASDADMKLDRKELEHHRTLAEFHAIEELLEVHEQVVRERTAQLVAALETNRSQMVELDRSNAELAQFAYVASHDLQEPLRAISGYLELLARRYQPQLDEQAGQFIQHAQDGAKRMQLLISDLLKYARVDSRGHTFSPVKLESALQQALANLQVALQESQATVDRQPLPTVMADEVQLAQLFQNLIANAVKFRSDSLPIVKITADRYDGCWMITVADNGIGFDMTHKDRVFEIFKRLHTREIYPGTGIGLAVCKKIVERHGGRIWVDSEPGKGTSFRFTMPDLV